MDEHAEEELKPVRCLCGQRLFDGQLFGVIRCPRCKRDLKFTERDVQEISKSTVKA